MVLLWVGLGDFQEDKVAQEVVHQTHLAGLEATTLFKAQSYAR